MRSHIAFDACIKLACTWHNPLKPLEVLLFLFRVKNKSRRSRMGAKYSRGTSSCKCGSSDILKFKGDKCTIFFDMAFDACIKWPLFSCPTEHAYETLLWS